MKNIHGGMLLLVKLQASACNFTKKYHSSMGFFHVFKIVQMVPNRAKRLLWLIFRNLHYGFACEKVA